MKRFIIPLLCLLAAISFAEKKTEVITSPPSLKGTWCTEDEGMILTFSGMDTLTVSSTSDESMGGSGLYTHTDSTFAATLKNGDLVLSMSYLYRWKGKDTVEAKATSFLINDEAVEFPDEWMGMVRCGGK